MDLKRSVITYITVSLGNFKSVNHKIKNIILQSYWCTHRFVLKQFESKTSVSNDTIILDPVQRFDSSEEEGEQRRKWETNLPPQPNLPLPIKISTDFKEDRQLSKLFQRLTTRTYYYYRARPTPRITRKYMNRRLHPHPDRWLCKEKSQ